MRRKYGPPIQHTVYKTGYKDALHDVGKAIDDLKAFGLRPCAQDTVDVIESMLGKLVPER
jgi:hypothetical protein